MKKIAFAVFSILTITVAYGNVPMPWMQTADVTNINQAIVGIIEKDTFKIPIAFPSFVPDPNGNAQYYASYDITQSGYILYLDQNPNCHGAQACNVFTLNASNVTVGSLESYRNLYGQVMTTASILNNGIQANYTQGYDNDSNPKMVWRQNNATYTLSWIGIPDTDQTRKAMIWMLNNLQIFAPPPANS